ncbi:LPS assembly lipoprotein LptE [Undibacterium sp. SXout11W]|uniref:LPS-assembly lipoprotein LptE n=1 Tax=Undibacterium sp. SXout11W TaxID=3413050 RepID=UPI003BF25184
MRHFFSRHQTWLLMIVVLMSLSACGFKLRGPVSFPFRAIYVAIPDSSPLGGDLRRQIRANGTTEVMATAEGAQVIMDVLLETKEKQILSLNSQGRVREYNLLYNFSFRLRNAEGKEYLEPVKMQLRRTITFNESTVLAKESEETALYRDMQNDLVQQVMRRLSVVKMDD